MMADDANADGPEVDYSLIHALRAGASFREIVSILESKPELIEVLDYSGLPPLLCACENNCNKEIIEFLVEMDPTAVRFINPERGNLPLHIVCYNKASFEVIQYVYKKYPGAISITDEHGRLPVHDYCDDDYDERMSLEILEFLVDKNIDSITARDNSGLQPLHFACGSCATLPIIQMLVQRWPDSVKSIANGRLPLHYICESLHGASIDAIGFLVETYPISVKARGCNGMLPLHYGGCAPMKTFIYLHQLYPEAIKVTDDHGRLPHHCASTLDNMRYLLQEYPLAIKVKDHNGNLPLHRACQREASLEEDQFLVASYPNAMLEVNMDGLLPVDLLIRPLFHFFPQSVAARKEWLQASMKVRWMRYGLHILLRALVENKRASLLDTSVWENRQALPNFVFVNSPDDVFKEIMSYL